MCFIQGVERVKEFLLRAFFTRQKLNVVDHQHVDMTIPLSQIHHFVIANGVDDLVRKLFGRQICNPEIASLGYIIPNGVQEVRLPQPGVPIDKEWVICFRRLFGHSHTGSMGKLVSGSHNEILECILRVKLYPPFRSWPGVLPAGYGGTPTSLWLSGRLFMKDDVCDRRLFATPGSRDGFCQKRSMMLA